MKNTKKLYIVKREVRANSIQEAIKNKGEIYEVTLAEDKYQPEKFVSDKLGFRKKL